MKQRLFGIRDSKEKLRFKEVRINELDEFLKIERCGGLVGGKVTEQPLLIIKTGKANRTPQEQCELQFNSICNKILDSGYKEVDNFNDLENIGFTATDTNGAYKPMKALAYQDVSNFDEIANNHWAASRKLNGVRCMMRWDGKKVTTSSRGGKDYDHSIKSIINNPSIINYFKNHPTIQLDGEIYKHGWSLQKISGLVRKSYAEEQSQLEYHVYDIIDTQNLDASFDERYHWLSEVENLYMINVCEHIIIQGKDEIWQYHNNWVEEGYEGLVLRNLEMKYGFNKRNKEYMVKVKSFKDKEFEVIGYKLGLRGTDDLIILCLNEDGKQFSAKADGNTTEKQYIIDNFEELKKLGGTVKFFERSEDNIPIHPHFLNFRKVGE